MGAVGLLILCRYLYIPFEIKQCICSARRLPPPIIPSFHFAIHPFMTPEELDVYLNSTFIMIPFTLMLVLFTVGVWSVNVYIAFVMITPGFSEPIGLVSARWVVSHARLAARTCNEDMSRTLLKLIPAFPK